MGVRKTLHVAKCAVLRREIIDGVLRGQLLLVLRRAAFLHVDRERDMGHFPVDLRDTVIFDPIKRLHAVAMDVEAAAERMLVACFHRETMFAVRFLKLAGRAVHGDHADLFLGPFLDGFVGQLHRHFTRPFDDDGSTHQLAVGIDGQVGREPTKVRLPARGAFKGLLKQGAGLGIVGDRHCCIDWGSMLHRGLLCLVVDRSTNYRALCRASTTRGRGPNSPVLRVGA